MPLSIIGAGLGRTGTVSMKLAIDQLGFGPCYHMSEVFKDPEAPARWTRAFGGEAVDWEAMFAGYNSSVDWPGAAFWRELADLYPDAKVILTVRDPESWYVSTQATIFHASLREKAEGTPFGTMLDAMRRHSLPSDVSDREALLAMFAAHNAAVRAAIPAERLLVFEVTQGWGPLCDFLGVPVPETPFPRANSTAEFLAR